MVRLHFDAAIVHNMFQFYSLQLYDRRRNRYAIVVEIHCLPASIQMVIMLEWRIFGFGKIQFVAFPLWLNTKLKRITFV